MPGVTVSVDGRACGALTAARTSTVTCARPGDTVRLTSLRSDFLTVCEVQVYIVMAYMVMAYGVMACIFMGCIVLAYVGMAYVVMSDFLTVCGVQVVL